MPKNQYHIFLWLLEVYVIMVGFSFKLCKQHERII